jgi:hypothetical protein
MHAPSRTLIVLRRERLSQMDCERMKIIHFKETNPQAWNRLVDESPEAWLYHRAEWVEVEALACPNESFMVESDEGKPLAVFCVYRSGKTRRLGLSDCYLHTGLGRGGPAIAQGLSDKQHKVAMLFALEYLRKRARACGANRLEVRLPSLAPAYLPPLRSEVNPLSEYQFGTFPKYSSSGIARLIGINTPTTIVELSGGDEETFFANCSHACRNLVRKASRLGVTCVQRSGLQGLEGFYRTYEASFRRSRSETRPLSFFRTIYERLAEKGMMRVFLALYDGKTIASALLLCYKNALTYYAGGTDYEAHQLSPTNLLIWESLKWARTAGWAWYETGPFFPYLPNDHKMARIGQFKREFGGKPHLLFEGLLVYDWRSYLAKVLLEEPKIRIPTWCRRMSSFLHMREKRIE